MQTSAIPLAVPIVAMPALAECNIFFFIYFNLAILDLPSLLLIANITETTLGGSLDDLQNVA